MCRSIAHEGFENNLIMTAIHAGTHSNPVLADDTLYAKTVITGKDELPDHQDIGVLKLKLIGIKNFNNKINFIIDKIFYKKDET